MPLSPGREALRLSQLTDIVSNALARVFGERTFWIIADVTSHTFKPDKNYHHFELVEKDPASNQLLAKIQAKAWSRGSLSISQFEQMTGQRFTDHINVLVNVSVNYHPVYGLQLTLHEIDVSFTLGALEQQRLATLDRLVAENPESITRSGDHFITKNKGLPLPSVIQHIAVVSSQTSAGWQDFQHTLQNNPHGYRFETAEYFTAVQGDSNAEAFVDRLIDIFNSQVPYDAVVIIRGGGAQTDFLIFDNYRIARAIARFPIPVITGIGHQKNQTIADLMAHTATKTPTRAAELIIDHNRAFEERIGSFQRSIIIKSQQAFSSHQQALTRINQVIVNQSKSTLSNKSRQLVNIASAVSAKPQVIVYTRLNDLQQVASNLGTFSAMYCKNQRGYLGHFISLIRVLSPENTLKRGFAIIKSDNHITSDPDKLLVGKEVEIILRDKSIISTIKKKTDYHGNEFDL